VFRGTSADKCYRRHNKESGISIYLLIHPLWLVNTIEFPWMVSLRVEEIFLQMFLYLYVHSFYHGGLLGTSGSSKLCLSQWYTALMNACTYVETFLTTWVVLKMDRAAQETPQSDLRLICSNRVMSG
jgi:hypothetical protein